MIRIISKRDYLHTIVEPLPISQSPTNINTEKKSLNDETEEKFTPLILAQHILSKSNLEQLFDALSTQPILVANGCEFLITVLDLLNRHMPVPLCISLTSFLEGGSRLKNEFSPTVKDENERMQVKAFFKIFMVETKMLIFKINDEGSTLPTIKSGDNSPNKTNTNALTSLEVNLKDPLIQIYSILLEVIPSRLSSLIGLLSNSCAPLMTSSVSSSPSHDISQTVKYQFISEPLG